MPRLLLRGTLPAWRNSNGGLPSKPEEGNGLSLESDTEAYAGHLRKARDLTEASHGFRDPRRQQGNRSDLAGE